MVYPFIPNETGPSLLRASVIELTFMATKSDETIAKSASESSPWRWILPGRR